MLLFYSNLFFISGKQNEEAFYKYQKSLQELNDLNSRLDKNLNSASVSILKYQITELDKRVKIIQKLCF
jgi:hypothetical protein